MVDGNDANNDGFEQIRRGWVDWIYVLGLASVKTGFCEYGIISVMITLLLTSK